MGIVYEVEDLTGLRIALKVPSLQFQVNGEDRTRFLNEMRLSASLRHPNIVQIYHGAEHDGQLYLAMELVDGVSLREELQCKSRLRVRDAVSIAKQIAAALVVAHSHDPPVVHRDLKPENVVLSSDGTAKILDFGIAKELDKTTSPTTFPLGTLAYMSPEQLDALGSSPASDVHALGVLLYEMLVGRPPFSMSLPTARLVNAICNEIPDRASVHAAEDIPRPLDLLISRLLDKAPESRPTAVDVIRELEALEDKPHGQEVHKHGSVTSAASSPKAQGGQSGPINTHYILEQLESKRWSKTIFGAVLVIVLAFGSWVIIGLFDERSDALDKNMTAAEPDRALETSASENNELANQHGNEAPSLTEPRERTQAMRLQDSNAEATPASQLEHRPNCGESYSPYEGCPKDPVSGCCFPRKVEPPQPALPAATTGPLPAATTGPLPAATTGPKNSDSGKSLSKATAMELDRNGVIDLKTLEEVAGKLKRSSQVRKVQIESHIASGLSKEESMAITTRRAKQVRLALIELGVPAGKLTAKGYGDTRPIDVIEIAKNTRIEFTIIDQVVKPMKVEIDEDGRVTVR